jgi:hypothetical protein
MKRFLVELEHMLANLREKNFQTSLIINVLISNNKISKIHMDDITSLINIKNVVKRNHKYFFLRIFESAHEIFFGNNPLPERKDKGRKDSIKCCEHFYPQQMQT